MTFTHDKFLNGRFVATQPQSGYRAGTDPVLLAAACGAQPGQSVLELGMGAGVASLCLATRVPDLALYGVEMQPMYAGLAMRNAARAGLHIQVDVADIATGATVFANQSFDHVIMNPPYFSKGTGTAAQDTGRATGRREQADLRNWLHMAAKRVRPKGYITLIQRIERLPDVLGHMPNSLGSVQVQPIAGRAGRAPNLFLLQARKGGRADFSMLPALAMYCGEKGKKNYTPAIHAVQFDAAPLACFG